MYLVIYHAGMFLTMLAWVARVVEGKNTTYRAERSKNSQAFVIHRNSLSTISKDVTL